MSDIISSDLPFTAEQRATLEAVLPMVIPASPDGLMPSAGEVGFLQWMDEFARDAVDAIQITLDRIDQAARESGGSAFAELETAGRQQVIDGLFSGEPRTLRPLTDQVMACYYSHERVLDALGANPGPPFPHGNEVKQADLTLLDPVRERGKIWRDA